MISSYIIPAILLIPSFLFFSPGKDYFASFMSGATEGLETAVKLTVPLTLIMCSVSMFTSSGAPEVLSKILSRPLSALGIPPDTLPFLLTRPFSGSAASGAFAELMKECGADSFEAVLCAVVMGSGDTAFYILSVYFSAAPNVRKTRYAYPVAAASCVFGVFFSCFICRLFF
ncbi:MAG: spore maturation protein [Clostridia bacterium]|nr:spore maturation protein [Clostridia bacterium]